MRTVLPIGYRLVSNAIRQARTEHQLDCGCLAKPGQNYHRVALAYQGKQIVYFKRHIFRCPNGPLTPTLPKSILH